MPSWIIIVAIITAVVVADIIYLVRRRKSGKCSCGHDCGTCGFCNDLRQKETVKDSDNKA